MSQLIDRQARKENINPKPNCNPTSNPHPNPNPIPTVTSSLPFYPLPNPDWTQIQRQRHDKKTTTTTTTTTKTHTNTRTTTTTCTKTQPILYCPPQNEFNTSKMWNRKPFKGIAMGGCKFSFMRNKNCSNNQSQIESNCFCKFCFWHVFFVSVLCFWPNSVFCFWHVF